MQARRYIVRRRSTFKESWSRDRITKGTNIRSRDSLLIIPGPDRVNPATQGPDTYLVLRYSYVLVGLAPFAYAKFFQL